MRNTGVCFPRIFGWFCRICIYLVMLAHGCQRDVGANGDIKDLYDMSRGQVAQKPTSEAHVWNFEGRGPIEGTVSTKLGDDDDDDDALSGGGRMCWKIRPQRVREKNKWD